MKKTTRVGAERERVRVTQFCSKETDESLLHLHLSSPSFLFSSLPPLLVLPRTK